jgi:hypothetical protein
MSNIRFVRKTVVILVQVKFGYLLSVAVNNSQAYAGFWLFSDLKIKKNLILSIKKHYK